MTKSSRRKLLCGLKANPNHSLSLTREILRLKGIVVGQDGRARRIE
jgi:hypothetical protein